MVEHIRSLMMETVRREAEKSLVDKKERLDNKYEKIKNEVKANYERVVNEFKSKII